MPALVALLAATLLPPSGAAPIYGPPAPVQRTTPDFTPGVAREVREIRSDIERGRDGGQLSGQKARRLKMEAGRIGMLEDRYAKYGLSESERAELRTRVEALLAVTNARRTGTIK